MLNTRRVFRISVESNRPSALIPNGMRDTKVACWASQSSSNLDDGLALRIHQGRYDFCILLETEARRETVETVLGQGPFDTPLKRCVNERKTRSAPNHQGERTSTSDFHVRAKFALVPNSEDYPIKKRPIEAILFGISVVSFVRFPFQVGTRPD